MDFKLTCSLQKTDTMILAIHNDPKFFNVCQIPDLFLSCASPEHHHEWGEAILTSPMMASLYLWHKCWSLLPGPSRRSLSQLFSTTEMISSSSIQIQSCLAIIFIYPSLPQSWFSEKWVPSNVSNIAIFHWTMSVGETVHANPPPPQIGHATSSDFLSFHGCLSKLHSDITSEKVIHLMWYPLIGKINYD